MHCRVQACLIGLKVIYRVLHYQNILACFCCSIVLILLSGCGDGSGGEPSDKSVKNATVVPSGAKPNILLIMADDLGVNDLSNFQADNTSATPNLDELAAQGITFTQHYADSVCSPARAALLSGLHPVRAGFTPNGRGLSPQLTTLPEALAAQGYTTWHIGKWHVGETLRQAWPDAQGFDHWFGFLNQWLLAGDEPDGVHKLSGPRYNNPWLLEDGSGGRYYRGHLENILTGKTFDVLEDLSEGDQPWFLNLWFFGPHDPVRPAKSFAQQYPDTAAGRYLALVNQLDHNVGQILERLEALGQRENTIVVFVSDNGGTNTFQDSNYPFFGGKGSYYQGAVRTPLIISWPDGNGAGTKYGGPTAIFDLYPTLMAAAGLPVPSKLDGINLLPDISNPKERPRQLYWENMLGFAARSANGKWWLAKDPWAAPEEGLFLADLESDPSGALDVSDEYPKEVVRLTAAYQKWQKEIHEIDIVPALDSRGQGKLIGSDFLRTPGFGEFTFAMGVEHGFEGNLASQDNVWSLSIDANGEVLADFQSFQLRGPLAGARTCHVVAVSGTFTPRIPGIRNVRDIVEMNLYVDGALVDTYSGDGKLDDSNFAKPTVIGEPEGQVHRLFEPVLLNATVDRSSSWSASSIEQRVCNL